MGHKKQAAGGKQPKETDAIKEKLQHYATFQRRIENKIERLVYLESVMGSPSSPNLSGMPGGSGTEPAKRKGKSYRRTSLFRRSVTCSRRNTTSAWSWSC